MRSNFSVVLLTALLMCALWTGTAGAVIPTVTYNSGTLPVAGVGGTITASGGNMIWDNTGTDGSIWQTILVASADVGTDPFVWTARFPAGVSFTGATTLYWQLDNSSGPADTVGRSLEITNTDIILAAPAGAGPSVPRPTGPFGIQLEREPARYIARLDATNDGTFETTIGTYSMTPAARPIQTTITPAAPVTVSVMSIAPGAAPPPPAPVPQATPSASAPTMSMWGLVVLAAVLVAVAVMSVRRWRVRRAN